MPNDPIIDTSGVVGTDGYTPIYNGNAAWQMWRLADIYVPGSIGQNRFVPKVGDVVLDTDLLIHYSVTSIDPGTLAANLDEITRVISDGSFSDDDLLLGVGPGTQSDTYRVYLDKSVTPYTLAVDARLQVAGSMVATCKIFKGADLTDQGNVISNFYDNSGNILGNAIPLEIVAVNSSLVNRTIKTVPICYTMQDLQDGEIVTAVFYSTAGKVVSKRQLLAENTSFIRQATSGVKYVTGISLECPFLSNTNPRLINLPINVLLQGLNMIGVVQYSDGSTARFAVNDTRFTVLGLDNFIATVIGQQVTIVLRYQLGSGEAAYGVNVGEDRFISETYRIITNRVEGSYDVKLYCYPVWRNPIDGYTLRWFLYNGDRQLTYDVTGMIEWSANSPAFQPNLLGTAQNLTVAINLNAVNGIYSNYRHVQTVSIVLLRQGTERITNWTIGFTPGQTPPYGEDLYANLTFVNTNYWLLKVDSGITTQAQWLDKLYYSTLPLIDELRETVPPAPTHYRIRYANHDYEFAISQWNAETVVADGLTNNGTVFLEFLRKVPDTTLQLSIAGLPIYQTV